MAITYKIGEAAALLNLKTYVLRFWETEFPDIVPLRTDKGQRLYTEENLALLERIRFLLHERGLTIEGARRALSEDKEKGLVYAFAPENGARPALKNEKQREDEKRGSESPSESGAMPGSEERQANGRTPAKGAEASVSYADEDDPDEPVSTSKALSAAGNAVKQFLSQYNLPGISKSYPIHEKPLSERLEYRHKSDQSASRRQENQTEPLVPGLAEATGDRNELFSSDPERASSPPSHPSLPLLRELAVELEAIARVLRDDDPAFTP